MSVKSDRQLILAPFLVAIFPAVHAIAHPRFTLLGIWEFIFMIAVLISAILIVLTKLLKSWERAALISTLGVGALSLFSLPVSYFEGSAVTESELGLSLLFVGWSLLWALIVWAGYKSSARTLLLLIGVAILARLNYSTLLRYEQDDRIVRNSELPTGAKTEYVIVLSGVAAPHDNPSPEEQELWEYLRSNGFELKVGPVKSADEIIGSVIGENAAHSRIELLSGGVIQPGKFLRDRYFFTGRDLWLRSHLVKHFPVPLLSQYFSRELFNNQRTELFGAIEWLLQKRDRSEPTTVIAHLPFPAGEVLFSPEGEVQPGWIRFDDSYSQSFEASSAGWGQYRFLVGRLKAVLTGIRRVEPDSVIKIESHIRGLDMSKSLLPLQAVSSGDSNDIPG